MGKKTKEIDAYINKSADFAKPILRHLRQLVHTTCPQVQEKIKWSMPFFDYKDEMMFNMAAFKQHAVAGFWKAPLMKDGQLLANARSEVSMGHLGKITSLKDLPSDKKMISYIKEAMLLNEQGIKLPFKPKAVAKKELIIPEYFTKALTKSKRVLQAFEAMSYSHKKEYIEWIADAKTEETRNKRMKSAIEMIKEGKSKNWKYLS